MVPFRLYRGHIGLYRDSGKENGNYVLILGISIDPQPYLGGQGDLVRTEKKMETIQFWGV